jgi:hypothetical protein
LTACMKRQSCPANAGTCPTKATLSKTRSISQSRKRNLLWHVSCISYGISADALQETCQLFVRKLKIMLDTTLRVGHPRLRRGWPVGTFLARQKSCQVELYYVKSGTLAGARVPGAAGRVKRFFRNKSLDNPWRSC